MHETIGGRYELIERLGSGGVSEVYRARDLLGARDVAIKRLHDHLSDHASRLEREIEIAGSIDHRRIAKFHELIEDRGRLCLVLELLPGGDLKRHILERGALPVGEAVRFTIEALEGLEAAHAVGIVHCDIKPHNLLLDAEGHVRITDFGLARTGARTNLAERSRAGTPDYAAPELTTGGYFDARSDLYSLGITLYEMICGEPPFQANTVAGIIWKHAHAEVPALSSVRSDIPAELDAIVRTATAKDPGDRFQTAREFRSALVSMSLPTRSAPPTTHPCPVCRGEVLDAFPACPVCGTVEAAVVRARPDEPKYRIVVTGPGKPGDRFDPQLRQAVLRFLRAARCLSPSMEKRFPRVPFILLKGLSRESADEARRSLEAIGLEVAVGGAGERQENRTIRRLLNRKALALYPRILLIGAGSSGGLYSSIGRASPEAMMAILAFVLIGAPALLRITQARPKAKPGPDEAPVTLRLVAASREVREPATRRTIAGIAGRLHAIDVAARSDVELETAGLELRKSISAAVSAIGTVAGGIASLERALLELDEADLYTHRTSDGGTDADAFVVRRNIESTLQLYTDRLLRFSVELDLLALRLGRIRAGRAGAILNELVGVADSLALETGSLVELEVMTPSREAS
jgi:hypothetical protein